MRELEVEALPPNEEIAPAAGRITFVDNQVDQTTGTIRIKATFPNSNRRLWPGQFVNVRVRLTSDPRAIVVPSVAVQAGPEGQYVYVVKSDQTVEMRPVVVARTAGAETVLKEGVKPGETVVTDGQLRLVPGSRITVKGGNYPKGGLMNLAALFIKRPITTTLITLGIVVFGVMSYRVLPVADLPAIDFPTISVSASLPGASPETMASAVALPLEKQFSTISGLTSMNSTNTQGSTSITLQFDLSRDIDAAAQDVQTMIAQGDASASAADAVAAVVLQGESRRLSGHAARDAVGDASAFDGERIRRFERLAAHFHGEWRRAGQRVRTAEIRRPHRRRPAQALGARHRHRRGRHCDSVVERQPADRHDGRPRAHLHGARRRSALECRVVRARWSSRTGTATRCGSADVARVYDGVEQDKTASWYQGMRNISLMIQKQPGSNVVQVVDDIKALLPVCSRAAAAVGAARRQNGSVGCRSANRSTTSS